VSEERTSRFGVRSIVSADSADDFFHPAVVSLMSGLTDMRSKSDAKKKAQESATAPPMETHTKVRKDPSTGQNVTDIAIKNFQANNPQQDVQEAYDRPQRNLVAMLQSLGYPVKDPTGPDIQEKLQTPEGKHELNREANTRLGAWIREKFGFDTKERIAGNVTEKRRSDLERTIKTAAPLVREADVIYREGKSAQTENRLSLAERRRSIDELLKSKSLHTLGESEDDVIGQINQSLEDQYGVGLRSFEEKQFRTTYRGDREAADKKESDQQKKDHDKEFSDFRKDAGIGAAESFKDLVGTWDNSKHGDLSKDELAQLQRDYSVKRQGFLKERKLYDKIASGTAEKPVRIGYSEAKDAPAEYLIGLMDDPTVNQRSVTSALRVHEEELLKEQRKVRDATKVKTAKVQSLRNAGSPTQSQSSQLDTLAVEINNSNARLHAIDDEVKQIRAARAKKTGGDSFSPEIERGIKAYMKAANVGRTVAIRNLRQAGKLK
jgi:hypothetical protein